MKYVLMAAFAVVLASAAQAQQTQPLPMQTRGVVGNWRTYQFSTDDFSGLLTVREATKILAGKNILRVCSEEYPSSESTADCGYVSPPRTLKGVYTAMYVGSVPDLYTWTGLVDWQSQDHSDPRMYWKQHMVYRTCPLLILKEPERPDRYCTLYPAPKR